VPARRRPTLQLEQQDGLGWPQLREQQRLTAHLPPAERAAAAQRAALLREHGWGAIREWLEAPRPHPGEAGPVSSTREQQLAAVFDEAA